MARLHPTHSLCRRAGHSEKTRMALTWAHTYAKSQQPTCQRPGTKCNKVWQSLSRFLNPFRYVSVFLRLWLSVATQQPGISCEPQKIVHAHWFWPCTTLDFLFFPLISALHGQIIIVCFSFKCPNFETLAKEQICADFKPLLLCHGNTFTSFCLILIHLKRLYVSTGSVNNPTTCCLIINLVAPCDRLKSRRGLRIKRSPETVSEKSYIFLTVINGCGVLTRFTSTPHLTQCLELVALRFLANLTSWHVPKHTNPGLIRL